MRDKEIEARIKELESEATSKGSKIVVYVDHRQLCEWNVRVPESCNCKCIFTVVSADGEE